MKIFDLTKIKNSLEQLQEMDKEVIAELRLKQSYYAQITGESKQYIHAVITGKYKLSPDKLIHIYKLILDDLKGIERVGKR